MKRFFIIFVMLVAASLVFAEAPILTRAGTSSGVSVDLNDDVPLYFGTNDDYWMVYDSTGTEFEFWTTNASGGTDGAVFTVNDGTDDVVFTGDISGEDFVFTSGQINNIQDNLTAVGINNTHGGSSAAATLSCVTESGIFYMMGTSDAFALIPAIAGSGGLYAQAMTNGLCFYVSHGGNMSFKHGTDMASGNAFDFLFETNVELTDTNGEQACVNIDYAINQSATGAATGVIIDGTLTSEGDGSSGTGNNLLSMRIAGTEKVAFDNTGVLFQAETTTPTARTNYGAVYPKSDNILYFQDGAGVEKAIQTGSIDYGEMGNVYGSSATEIIPSANEWRAMNHANITGSAPHLSSGFSFVAGSEGSGTTTTADSGNSINIADAAHGLADGDLVTVQSSNHIGVGTVLVTGVTDNTDNFEVDISYVANEAITWQMGSYLLVSKTGTYRGIWNASFSQSLNNTQTSTITPFMNTTQATKATASRLLANNSDVGAIGGNGIMSFTVNDRLWFACQTTAAQTLTFTIRNVSVH